MARLDVSAPTPDGDCPCTLHTPDGAGPWPAVIVFPDAFGARESIRSIADQVAEMGYAALVPDVYYRDPDDAPFDPATAFTDEAARDRLMAKIGSLTNDAVAADAGALLDLLATRPEVSGTKVGTTGYCMGGRLSLVVAGHHPDRVAAAASFHGGRIAVADDPTSPHLLADQLKAAVYVGAAKEDGSFTPEQSELLAATLTEAGVEHTIENYDARHGFAVSDNGSYDDVAAKRHFEAMRELFSTCLPA